LSQLMDTDADNSVFSAIWSTLSPKSKQRSRRDAAKMLIAYQLFDPMPFLRTRRRRRRSRWAKAATPTAWTRPRCSGEFLPWTCCIASTAAVGVDGSP